MGDDRNRILDLLADRQDNRRGGRPSAWTRSTPPARRRPGPTLRASAGGEAGWSKFFAGGAKAWRQDRPAGSTGAPKFMYVKVVSVKGDNVNVKIPLNLVRAGLKLTSLIPQPGADQINKTMAEKGMSFDLNNFKPEDLDELHRGPARDGDRRRLQQTATRSTCMPRS